jgi:hypothetical protein
MSAYIVNMETISVLAKAFVQYHVAFTAEGYEKPIQIIINYRELYDGIGQALLDQNYRSVNARYDEDTKTPKFRYANVEIDEGMVYGCICCYDYQACETEDYFESDLYRSLQRLKNKLLERLLSRKGLKAPWGYGGHNILE